MGAGTPLALGVLTAVGMWKGWEGVAWSPPAPGQGFLSSMGVARGWVVSGSTPLGMGQGNRSIVVLGQGSWEPRDSNTTQGLNSTARAGAVAWGQGQASVGLGTPPPLPQHPLPQPAELWPSPLSPLLWL